MSTRAQPHIDALANNGYTVVQGSVDNEAVTQLLIRIKRLNSERSRAPDDDQPLLNRGHDVLYNLQREDLAFIRAFTGNPVVMEILHGLLNDIWYKQIPADRPNFIVRALAGRSSGKGPLPLHIDSFIPSSGRICFASQVAIILEDQTPENGCTLVVPGSHRFDRYADQEAITQALQLSCRAGDVVIWDGRLWHGALSNTTGNSRWSLIGTFVRWWLKQNYDITGTLPPAIFEQLSEDEKVILGYCSMPPRDEFERVDIKSGYDQLKDHVADYRRR